MQLTQKESDLLKDLKTMEQLCVDKYSRNASMALDAQLKGLFTRLSQNEQKHLDAIMALQGGTVTQLGGGNSAMPQFTATYNYADTPEKQNDCFLCTDLLSGEKSASHLYDTCIFEFTDEKARQMLGQIQTQEQNHGKMLYDYMSANSMY